MSTIREIRHDQTRSEDHLHRTSIYHHLPSFIYLAFEQPLFRALETAFYPREGRTPVRPVRLGHVETDRGVYRVEYDSQSFHFRWDTRSNNYPRIIPEAMDMGAGLNCQTLDQESTRPVHAVMQSRCKGYAAFALKNNMLLRHETFANNNNNNNNNSC